jgi:alkanesulfonate monooxygenase SsuD/methylene tetrahydromethanopterin reductase-like flavin-dependent oxidoreductase (luciferase family)
MTLHSGWGFAVNNFYSGDQAEVREMLALGAEAEAAGFDAVWVGDHVLWHTPIIDALSLLGAFAGTTERVTLGTAILLLGLRQPAIAAKAITSLNAMTDGRFVLGVGVGGENPEEFEVSGVPHNERGKRLDEALRFLVAQWGEEGKVEPTGPPLPILVGGRSDASRRRVKRFGAGWLASFVSPKRIREEVELLRADDPDVPIVLNVYFRTGDDVESTRREAGAFLSRAYNMEEGPLMRYTVAGTPESCAEDLAAYAEAGVQHFVLRPAAWNQREQLDQWGSELLPRVREIALA